jgi:hypothetical protein
VKEWGVLNVLLFNLLKILQVLRDRKIVGRPQRSVILHGIDTATVERQKKSGET